MWGHKHLSLFSGLTTPLINIEAGKLQASITPAHRRCIDPTTGRLWWLSFGSETVLCDLKLPGISLVQCPPSTARRPAYWSFIVSAVWSGLDNLRILWRVLLQEPLVSPWGCWPGHFQFKYDRIRIHDLPRNFNPEGTHKTRRNMLIHARLFQGKSFERHWHYWMFDLRTSWNFTQCL